MHRTRLEESKHKASVPTEHITLLPNQCMITNQENSPEPQCPVFIRVSLCRHDCIAGHMTTPAPAPLLSQGVGLMSPAWESQSSNHLAVLSGMDNPYPQTEPKITMKTTQKWKPRLGEFPIHLQNDLKRTTLVKLWLVSASSMMFHFKNYWSRQLVRFLTACLGHG